MYAPQETLLDIRFPDFTARHVFSAKLRLVILLGWWVICLFFYPGLLTIDQPILLIVSATFTVTTICYALIFRKIFPIFFFIVELAADVATQTVLVYLTGGPKSNFFTIYIIYCCAGGLFYNYKVSAVITLLSIVFYSGLLLATHLEWLREFHYPFNEIGFFQSNVLLNNWWLLTVFLVIGIYGIRLAHHFTEIREEALQDKNRELTALNKISSTTRSHFNLKQVGEEVLRGVKEGLGYDASFLVTLDDEGSAKIFTPKNSTETEVFEKELGISGTSISLEESFLSQVMKKREVAIRYELSAVTRGVLPTVSPEKAAKLQRQFGLKKFIAAPLVAEEKVLGVLVGMTTRPWIETEAIEVFEGFADQAALVLDNVLLINRLRRQNAQLERVSRVKSEFLSTMSHELRTPLTAIIGFSELLLEGAMGDLSRDQRESLREVLTNGESLLELINSLLDLAKIEAGKMELHLEPVHLPSLFDRVQGMLYSLIQKKGHQLKVDFSVAQPVIQVDEKRLQQILLNLVSNAIKFTPEGGTIEVVARQVPLENSWRKRVKNPEIFSGGALQISVRDNGIGIQGKHMAKIFNSFEQADGSYTRSHEGTGLGLALTRQFVELHGGGIWVESQPDQGSTFTFVIPIR